MSGFKVAVALGFAVALSFVVGRWSSSRAEVPVVDRGPVAASWDGGVLLRSEVDAYLSQMGPSAAGAGARQELIAALAHQALLASSGRARGIDKLPGVQRQCDEVIVTALRETQLKTDVDIPEGELRAAYDRELSRYSQAGGTKVAHILLAADEAKRAASLLRELTEKSKKDFYAFSDAAQVQSIDGASKLGGGELPPMTEAQLNDNFGGELATQLSALEPGAIVPKVIATPRGLHIIRLVERIPGSITPFERVRESIATQLRAEREAQAWKDYVKQLEGDTGFTLTP